MAETEMKMDAPQAQDAGRQAASTVPPLPADAIAIIPVRDIFPRHERRYDLATLGLIGLGALAYVGVPGATLLADILVVLGSLAVAAYLVYCGRRGRRVAS